MLNPFEPIFEYHGDLSKRGTWSVTDAERGRKAVSFKWGVYSFIPFGDRLFVSWRSKQGSKAGIDVVDVRKAELLKSYEVDAPIIFIGNSGNEFYYIYRDTLCCAFLNKEEVSK